MSRYPFAIDNRGSVSVIFAVMLTVLVAFLGAAVDVSRFYRAQHDYQNALDSAVLASLSAPTDHEGAERFNSYLNAKGIASKTATYSRVVVGSEIIASGTHHVSVQTPLLSVIGIKTFEASLMAEAAAPMRPETIELKLNQAYGWSNKDVQFWVQRPDGTKEVIASLKYLMTDKGGADWRGTGTTTILPSANITIGEFTSLWVEMQVHHEDGTNVMYSSRDPASSDHVFVDGKQMPLGKSVLITELIPCNTTVEHSMEDMPTDSDPINWEKQDISYDVTTTCTGSSSGVAHLSK
ncbi:MAG: TadE/TadG family type IV pilus assembly protein [Hyphomicrobium sp.]